MPTCPKGHTSAATDYCDECGAPIAGAAPAPAPAPSTSEAAAVAAPAGEPCPECQTPRDGRFCEVCGHDFLAEPGAAPSAAPAVPSATGPAAPAATTEAAPDGAPASPSPAGSAGAAATASSAATATAGAAPTATTGWRVVVTADRVYHAFMDSERASDADPVPFPSYCPERRFPLTGAEMLIGRRSRSRGIEPAVDLTGPPEDPGISHMHALLVATPTGGWNLVDLDSANGTYLNDGREPIHPNEPVSLSIGDQIHVGAWTTLTVQSA